MTHNLRDILYQVPNESLHKHFKDTNCTVVDSFIHGETDCIVTSLAHRGCMRKIFSNIYATHWQRQNVENAPKSYKMSSDLCQNRAKLWIRRLLSFASN